MTIHHVTLVALFALLRTRTVSTSACQWHNAIEFWSNVVCSMEDIKTVNFHDVLESGRSSIVLERCFQAFVYDIARKCETTIVSRIHALDDAENLASFVSNNDIAHIAHRFAKRASSASIWQVTSNDALPSRVRPSAAAGKIRIRSDKTFDGNTWNVHVILAKDIHSFDQIARGDTTFEWNSHDRFIVLITRFPEEQGPSNESNSRIGNILKTLWSKLWGKVERTSVKTAEEASSVLSHLIYRRTKNMNGYELKVGYFKQGHTLAEPTKVQSNTHYADYVFKGFDEIVLNTIARDMNFKVEHIHPTDNKSYGYQLPNGTYVGAIGKFYLSYLLPKNSILNEKINAVISQLNQAGLPSLWSQHIVHTFIVQKWSLAKEKLTRNGKGMDGFVPFNLSDVQSSFYMLLIGLSISTIVFLCEKGWLKVPLLHTK
ncbi:Glutamate receptor delta-2 subunit [Temnothorax longispinosus]|uniref:Glutamate receptor delta-2 subunit n=1 Tax=Temnothorax longispinosus TaxID=300112 RepID=A0A4S2KXB0_9HYME|nr:Glutamate receptor delta-2 subunit [Temnothorax longispinosus]